MKNNFKITLMIIMFLALSAKQVSAHGLIYETKKLDNNKIRVTLKWSNPKEAKGIIISYFSLKNGKTLNVGYELKDKAPVTAYLDLDQSEIILPARVIINKVGDLNWRPFKDIKGNEAEEYIRHLHDAGIIDAGKDGKFRPGEMISRAEFAEIMVKALKLEKTPEPKNNFKDIEKNPAKKYILIACKHGLLSGYKDKTFKPGNPVSIVQVCTAVSKAFDFKTNRNGIYTGLKQGKDYSSAVKRIFDAGILNVDDSIYKKFNEESNISRANCAKMISRAISTY